MKCWKCDKEMDREDDGPTLKGISVVVSISPDTPKIKETIAYNNLQLGKYSDGNGDCDVAICYECYIDAAFHKGVFN